MKEQTEKSMQLYRMLQKRGYPEDFCDLISKNLNTDFTASRMIGYLSRYSNLPVVEIVDEMLAILSDRDAIISKKKMEYNQAKINEWYNR